jgi:acyl-CoA thioester hydrolase
MPKPSLVSAEVELRVPFHDLDPLEVVWHGNHAKYFEIARGALLDRLNYSYSEMKASGYVWPVIELFVRYAHPLRYAQRICVRADLLEWDLRLKIGYLVRDVESGRRLVHGHTVQVAVSAATGELCLAWPEVLRERLGRGPS